MFQHRIIKGFETLSYKSLQRGSFYTYFVIPPLWRASSSKPLSFSRNSLRFLLLALFKSLRAFFHENPKFLRVLRIDSRQHLRLNCLSIQAAKRFNVQRGFCVIVCCLCWGGVAANSRA